MDARLSDFTLTLPFALSSFQVETKATALVSLLLVDLLFFEVCRQPHKTSI